MTVRCSNNGEFLHQKVPLNTQWKILSPRLIWKNLSNAVINFFLQKKATDWIYIMFYPQMSNFSEQNFSTETFLRSFVCKLTQQNNSATYSKHVKLPLVSFFELHFLPNFSSKPWSFTLKNKVLTNSLRTLTSNILILETKQLKTSFWEVRLLYFSFFKKSFLKATQTLLSFLSFFFGQSDWFLWNLFSRNFFIFPIFF